MDAVTNVPPPRNEPVLTYAPGTPERAALQQRLTELAGDPLELTMTIGDEHRLGGGERFDVVQPHRHAAVLGTAAHATHADAQEAVACAKAAAPAWQDLSFDDRAAVFLPRSRRALASGTGGRYFVQQPCNTNLDSRAVERGY